MRPQKSQSPVGAIVLEPIWLRGGSETVLVPENEPHLDQPAGPPTLNASQHHQSSSHSKQIAAIPYSRQIGQFRQTQLNFGASSVTNRQTWKSKNFSSKHLSSVFNKLAHHITLEILCHSCPFWQDFSSETTQYVWNGGYLSTIYFSRSASRQLASGREGM